jgi:hypothetical protein
MSAASDAGSVSSKIRSATSSGTEMPRSAARRANACAVKSSPYGWAIRGCGAGASALCSGTKGGARSGLMACAFLPLCLAA